MSTIGFGFGIDGDPRAGVGPLLAVVSIGLLGWALQTRLAAERSCPLPAPAPSTAEPTSS